MGAGDLGDVVWLQTNGSSSVIGVVLLVEREKRVELLGPSKLQMTLAKPQLDWFLSV